MSKQTFGTRIDPWVPMNHQLHIFTLSAGDPGETQERQASVDLSRKADFAQDYEGHCAPLLNALRESRRIQAARIIRQYQHLVAEARAIEPLNNVLQPEHSTGGNVDMAINNHSHDRRPNGSMSFKAWILIAVTVIGFGILHVFGGITLLNASSAIHTETPPATIHGD